MSELVSPSPVRKPWLIAAVIVFFLALAVSLFFLFYGIPLTFEDYTQGYVGVVVNVNDAGEIVLDPSPGYDAANTGVATGDILLSVDGRPVPSDVDEAAAMLRGPVGGAVDITVRKSDGSEKTYTIIRSSKYKKTLDSAGVTEGFLAGYFTILPLLVGLGFAALGIFLLFRRPAKRLYVLAAFALLFFPYSLNAIEPAYNAALATNLGWLYNLLRAAGLFLTLWLLLVFPDGRFVPKWSRWALIVVAVWMIPYYLALVIENFLPSLVLDISWIAIIAAGIAAQVYRYLRVSTGTERRSTRLTVIAALAALFVYLLVWLSSSLLPATVFSNAGWLWYSLVANLLIAAMLLFFGGSLTRAAQKLK